MKEILRTGRPRKKISAEEVRKWAALGLSQRKAAVALGMSESGLRGRLQMDGIIAQAWAEGAREFNAVLPLILQKASVS